MIRHRRSAAYARPVCPHCILNWDDRPQPTAREMLDNFSRAIACFLAIWGTVVAMVAALSAILDTLRILLGK